MMSYDTFWNSTGGNKLACSNIHGDKGSIQKQSLSVILIKYEGVLDCLVNLMFFLQTAGTSHIPSTQLAEVNVRRIYILQSIPSTNKTL